MNNERTESAMDLTVILGALLGGAGGVYALMRLMRGLWRVNRRIVKIADLVQELSPNHGTSIKDQVTETATTSARTERKVDKLDKRLTDHIRDGHQGG